MAHVLDRLHDAHRVEAVGARDVLIQNIVAADGAGNSAGEDAAAARGLECPGRIGVGDAIAGVGRPTRRRAVVLDQRHDTRLGLEAGLVHRLLADRRIGNVGACRAGVAGLGLRRQRQPVGEGLVRRPQRKLHRDLLAGGIGRAVVGAEVEAEAVADRIDRCRRRRRAARPIAVAQHLEGIGVGAIARRHGREVVDRQRQEGVEVEVAVVALRQVIGHRVGDELARLHVHRITRIDGRVADLGDLHGEVAVRHLVGDARIVHLGRGQRPRNVAGDVARPLDGVGRHVAFAQGSATVGVGIVIEHLGVEGDRARGAVGTAHQGRVATGLRGQECADIEDDLGLAVGVARLVAPGIRDGTLCRDGLAVIDRHGVGDGAEIVTDRRSAIARDAEYRRHAGQQGHAVAQNVLELEVAQVEIVRDLEVDRVLDDVAGREAGGAGVGVDGAADLDGERLGHEARIGPVAGTAHCLGPRIEGACSRRPIARRVGVGRAEIDLHMIAGHGIDDLAAAHRRLRHVDRNVDRLLRAERGIGDRDGAGRRVVGRHAAARHGDRTTGPLHVVRQLELEREIVDRLPACGRRRLQGHDIVRRMARAGRGFALTRLSADRRLHVQQLDVEAGLDVRAHDDRIAAGIVQRVGAVLVTAAGDHLQAGCVGELAAAVEAEIERDLGLGLRGREAAERQGDHIHRVTRLETRRRGHESGLTAGIEAQRVDGTENTGMAGHRRRQDDRLHVDIGAEELRGIEDGAIVGDRRRVDSGRHEQLDERAVARAVRCRVVESECRREVLAEQDVGRSGQGDDGRRCIEHAVVGCHRHIAEGRARIDGACRALQRPVAAQGR